MKYKSLLSRPMLKKSTAVDRDFMKAVTLQELAPPIDATHPARAIGQLIYGYRGAQILFTAANLNLFRTIADTHDLDAICKALHTVLHPTKILLDSLVAMDFLTKTGSRYYNTPLTERFLVPGSPDYMGDNLKYQNQLWSNWGRLEEVLRTGRPRRSLDQLLTRVPGPFVREYIRGMNNIARNPAKELARILPLGQAKRMLDIGAGPGTFTRELLARHPRLRADIIDLPRTLTLTRSFLSDLITRKRVNLKQGDYHRASFGSQIYDLVLLSHVTHDEGSQQNEVLIHRAAASTRPGGIVAIHDFILNDDHTHPSFSALFSAHMLVSTRSGQVYSQKEYKEWMHRAGIDDLRRHEVCAGAPNATVLLFGFKEGH